MHLQTAGRFAPGECDRVDQCGGGCLVGEDGGEIDPAAARDGDLGLDDFTRYMLGINIPQGNSNREGGRPGSCP